MLETPVLTDQQISDFRRDGYVVVRGGFGAADMRRIEGWTRELAELPETPGRHWVYHEKSRLDPNHDLICRIEKISPYHVGFAELSRTLKNPVGQLLGEEAVLFKEKINFKFPGGDGFKPHQDSQAGWWNYGSYYITAMVCIDEATLE
ncbi:MAG: phytanoyl-CoA dioxygenase family protein, partial [Alphaproteobacteria bacterium]